MSIYSYITDLSLFGTIIGMYSRYRTNLLLGYAKVVVKAQAKLELLRSVSLKVITVESLVCDQNKFCGLFEPV